VEGQGHLKFRRVGTGLQSRTHPGGTTDSAIPHCRNQEGHKPGRHITMSRNSGEALVTTATISDDLLDKIEHAFLALGDHGFNFVFEDARSLIEGIDDPDVASAELRELARLVELSGHQTGRKVYYDLATPITGTEADEFMSDASARRLSGSFSVAGYHNGLMVDASEDDAKLPFGATRVNRSGYLAGIIFRSADACYLANDPPEPGVTINHLNEEEPSYLLGEHS
jgi:hypothetical protein